MSTGLARLAAAGMNARVGNGLSASEGSSSPAASQASAHRMPRPPAFVSTPTRRPRGSGCRDSRAARSSSSSSVRARSTPAWWNSASTAVSEPASAAVWELAARAPVAVLPLFIARIGFDERRDGPAARTYAGCRTTRDRAAPGSSPRRPPTIRAGRWRRHRPCCRSTRMPKGRRHDSQRPRSPPARARRFGRKTRFVPTSAPRERRIQAWPGRRDAEAVRPDQPATVIRTSSSSRRWSSAPSVPTSANPAEITISARMPRADRTPPRRLRLTGTQTTARSTASDLLDRAVPGTQTTASPSRLTGYAAPSKPPLRRCGTARRRSNRVAAKRRARRPAGVKNGISDARRLLVSAVDTFEERGGRRDRERDLDYPLMRLARSSRIRRRRTRRALPGCRAAPRRRSA